MRSFLPICLLLALFLNTVSASSENLCSTGDYDTQSRQSTMDALQKFISGSNQSTYTATSMMSQYPPSISTFVKDLSSSTTSMVYALGITMTIFVFVFVNISCLYGKDKCCRKHFAICKRLENPSQKRIKIYSFLSLGLMPMIIVCSTLGILQVKELQAATENLSCNMNSLSKNSNLSSDGVSGWQGTSYTLDSLDTFSTDQFFSETKTNLSSYISSLDSAMINYNTAASNVGANFQNIQVRSADPQMPTTSFKIPKCSEADLSASTSYLNTWSKSRNEFYEALKDAIGSMDLAMSKFIDLQTQIISNGGAAYNLLYTFNQFGAYWDELILTSYQKHSGQARTSAVNIFFIATISFGCGYLLLIGIGLKRKKLHDCYLSVAWFLWTGLHAVSFFLLVLFSSSLVGIRDVCTQMQIDDQTFWKNLGMFSNSETANLLGNCSLDSSYYSSFYTFSLSSDAFTDLQSVVEEMASLAARYTTEQVPLGTSGNMWTSTWSSYESLTIPVDTSLSSPSPMYSLEELNKRINPLRSDTLISPTTCYPPSPQKPDTAVYDAADCPQSTNVILETQSFTTQDLNNNACYPMNYQTAGWYDFFGRYIGLSSAICDSTSPSIGAIFSYGNQLLTHIQDVKIKLSPIIGYMSTLNSNDNALSSVFSTVATEFSDVADTIASKQELWKNQTDAILHSDFCKLFLNQAIKNIKNDLCYGEQYAITQIGVNLMCVVIATFLLSALSFLLMRHHISIRLPPQTVTDLQVSVISPKISLSQVVPISEKNTLLDLSKRSP